ncbi:MAG: hypothetical protein ACI4HM_00040 [Ruminococcus sp.]
MKKLIIVCEEKCRQYGDYLAQLISLEDDTENEMVGTKDGEVAAQVWLEKDYKANAAQLSSNQYILFIGQDKLIKEKSSHMNMEFSEFGMKYGWLGKQAVLSVEKVVEADKYENFISYVQNYQQNVEQLIKSKDKKTLKSGAAAGATKAGALAVLSPVALVPIAGVMAVKKFTLNSKIKEQQYSCAVMKFYLDDLSKFLGL